MDSAVEVLSVPLPSVRRIKPGSFNTRFDGELTVLGDNLDLTEASLVCRDASDSTAPTVTIPVTVGAGDSESYTVTVDMDSASAGLICIVELTNANGAQVEYSSLSITTPSGIG